MSFQSPFLKNKAPALFEQTPTSTYKKLIILTLRLVQALCMMSIAKAVTKGIKDCECKRFALQECPPVPYVSEKDPIQVLVSLLKSDQSLKTTIEADAELRQPIWHCRMHEAFLMHMSSALGTIKKWGTFKAYKQAHEAYVEQKEAAKEAKVNMNLFATAASKGKKATKKGTEKALKEASGKNCSEKEKASQKTKDLILGTVTMKEFGINLNLRDKMITTDGTILPMRDINKLQGSSMLRALQNNHSLAMELQSTQDATNCAIRILDAKYNKADLRLVVRDNCKHLKVDQQKKLLSCSLTAPYVTGKQSQSPFS
jgi:hypothetical protein